jgi:hypothetical protein
MTFFDGFDGDTATFSQREGGNVNLFQGATADMPRSSRRLLGDVEVLKQMPTPNPPKADQT